MSKIQFEQISEDIIEVVIPAETPMDMVQQLTKSLTARGLVEDLSNSTLTVRYFYRPQDELNKKADELIKSLKRLSKEDEPYWTPKAKFTNQKRVREMEIKERRAKLGIGSGPKPNTSPAPAPNTTTGPKMYDHGSNTAGGTGKRYAYIKDPVEKDDDMHDELCECEKCDMAKSGYGPKKAGLYNPVDNARRKARNTGDQTGIGANVNTKAYSTKPGQLSARQQASAEAAKIKAMNRKQPVKRYSPEEIARLNQERQFKKAWADHLPFPNAEEEMSKLAQRNPVEQGDDAMANQLANMMNSKAMLNPSHRQPSSEDMIMAGEQMGLGASEQMIKAQDQQWNGAINNWLAEATKPISQRFASEEEELAYWSSLKVADRDDGSSGY